MADWETVTILRKKAPKASAMKSEQVCCLAYLVMCCILEMLFSVTAPYFMNEWFVVLLIWHVFSLHRKVLFTELRIRILWLTKYVTSSSCENIKVQFESVYIYNIASAFTSFCIFYFRLSMQHVGRVLRWTLSQNVSGFILRPVAVEYKLQLCVTMFSYTAIV
jgi:hypothetical protein